jgi:hypothetical protein
LCSVGQGGYKSLKYICYFVSSEWRGGIFVIRQWFGVPDVANLVADMGRAVTAFDAPVTAGRARVTAGRAAVTAFDPPRWGRIRVRTRPKTTLPAIAGGG